jgi:hypothetical protein|tara:strand:- start:723 stop:1244 length:522 start_codon:yes stop_codon:yes gene_type:complete
MKLGKIKIIILVLFFNSSLPLLAEDTISSVPLINLENLKPSYEEDEKDEVKIENNNSIKIKEKNTKNTNNTNNKKVIINMLGLDKITAKTTKINIKLGETKKFGLLQIKAIKCGKINSINNSGEAAYIQVKDTSDNKNEQIFVFNGWTFSSSPSLRPVDHPVYDLWLIGCENV